MNKKKCVEEVNTAIGDLMTHKKKVRGNKKKGEECVFLII